ncbi:MAG: NYN domain-containing protein [Opitutales bacterium]|nr:NYN domain-containing protein [Opitutales bacterium]
MNKTLILDACNLLHASPDYRELMAHNFDAALDQLTQEARVFHDLDGLPVSLVIDGKGETIDWHHPTSEPHLSWAYAPKGISADTVIERWVCRWPNPAELTVVTGDRALAQTVESHGAQTWSPGQFMDEVNSARRRLTQKTRTVRKKSGPLSDDWKSRLPDL